MMGLVGGECTISGKDGIEGITESWKEALVAWAEGTSLYILSTSQAGRTLRKLELGWVMGIAFN